jgi:RNA polymerase sigma-70 factor (ECF subfamily)
LSGRERPRDVREVYDAQCDFVWATLRRFGVPERDAEDLLQEVFVVVHQRLTEFDPERARISTWIFGICLNVARAHKRRAVHRRERQAISGELDAISGAAGPSPDAALASAEDRARLEDLLDTLDLEKRAVVVMFEIDEIACDEIAAMLGIPIGTVHSRLHAARKELAKAAQRLAARDAREASEASEAVR